MKYIKKFEDKFYIKKIIESIFKSGDIVYCIDDKRLFIINKGEKYMIRDVIYDDQEFKYTLLDSLGNDEVGDVAYSERRFISELDYNANKYNL
jgi:hypothetical protein